MEKKVYLIENLDCANCAAEVEAKLNTLPEVKEAVLTYATGQLRITAEDPDSLLPLLQKTARGVEPEVVIRPRDSAGQPHSAGHDHAHHHDHDHEHEHHHDHDHEGHDHGEEEQESPLPLFLGAGLFVLGLILEALGLKWVGLFCYVAAYVVLGAKIVWTAVTGLVRGRVFDENFLMSLASLGAFFIGEYPEAVGVMLFYRIGEYFEDVAVARSRSRIMEAVDLRPEVVTVPDGDGVRQIPAAQAKVGDTVLVRPGDRIPLDGVVLTGTSRLDTAPITGEPVPVPVGPGDAVTSGCVNTSGQLTLRVEKPLSESMVSRILDAVENAAASKPKIDRFITRFARVYTPVVVAAAVAVAVIPSLVDGNWNYWVYTALSFLVMSCPCALVLSVPLAFFSGIGAGGKQGILFKGGASIEAMAGIRAVALDKTGTVTKGEFVVQEARGREDLLSLCASCEQFSTHPIAGSIVAAAKERGLPICAPEGLEELSGRGIRARVNGLAVLCGNEKLMAENGVDPAAFRPTGAGTHVLVAVDGKPAGWLRIADTLKPDAKDAVARLKAGGVTPVMLTGDGAQSAGQVAQAVGIEQVHARLLPEEKLARLQELRQQVGPTMFVGDGINDAPVLSGADVGAAMGTGADAAIEAADVVYMTGSVDAIPESLAIARRTRRIAIENVVFALAVKLAVMLLGLFGHASMWMAVFADTGVAMLCILNSIRGQLPAGRARGQCAPG